MPTFHISIAKEKETFNEKGLVFKKWGFNTLIPQRKNYIGKVLLEIIVRPKKYTNNECIIPWLISRQKKSSGKVSPQAKICLLRASDLRKASVYLKVGGLSCFLGKIQFQFERSSYENIILYTIRKTS